MYVVYTYMYMYIHVGSMQCVAVPKVRVWAVNNSNLFFKKHVHLTILHEDTVSHVCLQWWKHYYIITTSSTTVCVSYTCKHVHVHLGKTLSTIIKIIIYFAHMYTSCTCMYNTCCHGRGSCINCVGAHTCTCVISNLYSALCMIIIVMQV